MSGAIPRPEYPRPQLVRDDWLCLNGAWQFEVDAADRGADDGRVTRDLAGVITVPFCPESTLAGVGRTDFLHAVWYRRVVSLPAGWAGRRAVLHFAACDYDATVWADGAEVVDAVLTTYRPGGHDNALFIESDTLTHGDLYDPARPQP